MTAELRPVASVPEPANDAGAAPALPPLTPAQNELVHLGLPVVERAAEETARRYHGRIQPEELLGPGTLGLMEAARNYDEDQHPSFFHYARFHILGRMVDALRAEHASLRARVEHAMERSFCRFSSHQTLDVDLFADPEEKLLDGARRGADDALAAALVAAIFEAEGMSPEDAIVERIAITEAVATLPSHEQEVIRLVHVNELTLDEVARTIGATSRTAQRRYTSALGKLRELLVNGASPAPSPVIRRSASG